MRLGAPRFPRWIPFLFATLAATHHASAQDLVEAPGGRGEPPVSDAVLLLLDSATAGTRAEKRLTEALRAYRADAIPLGFKRAESFTERARDEVLRRLRAGASATLIVSSHAGFDGSGYRLVPSEGGDWVDPMAELAEWLRPLTVWERNRFTLIVDSCWSERLAEFARAWGFRLIWSAGKKETSWNYLLDSQRLSDFEAGLVSALEAGARLDRDRNGKLEWSETLEEIKQVIFRQRRSRGKRFIYTTPQNAGIQDPPILHWNGERITHGLMLADPR